MFATLKEIGFSMYASINIENSYTKEQNLKFINQVFIQPPRNHKMVNTFIRKNSVINCD